MDNGQATVKESVLVNVFEMLVERLTALEKKIDRLEESIENEQATRYGRLNSKAFLDFSVEIYVYKPFKGDRVGSPAMYCLYFEIEEDSVHHVGLYKTLEHELFEGKYSDNLGDGVEEIIQRLKSRELEDDESWRGAGCLRCRDFRIESERKFLQDHLLDLKCQPWISRNQLWQSIRCEMDFGLTMWLEPSEGLETSCNVVKCVQAALALLDFLKFKAKPRGIRIGTLGKHIAKVVNDYDIASQCHLYSDDEEASLLESKMKKIRKHALWDEIKGHGFWDNTLGLGIEPVHW